MLRHTTAYGFLFSILLVGSGNAFESLQSVPLSDTEKPCWLAYQNRDRVAMREHCPLAVEAGSERAEYWQASRTYDFKVLPRILQEQADKGEAWAMVELADLYNPDESKSVRKYVPENAQLALSLYEKAADLEDKAAFFNLIVWYGHQYTAHAERQVAKYTEKLAVLGDWKSQIAIGFYYIWGQGLDQNLAKARYWFDQSALNKRNGSDPMGYGRNALVGLGAIEEELGHTAKALEYYEKAAAKYFELGGAAIATSSFLASMYMRGIEVRQDYVKARELYDRAGDLSVRCHHCDNLDADYNLGLIYEHGLGVDADIEKAKEYYTRSAYYHNTSAIAALQRLKQKQPVVEKNPN